MTRHLNCASSPQHSHFPLPPLPLFLHLTEAPSASHPRWDVQGINASTLINEGVKPGISASRCANEGSSISPSISECRSEQYDSAGEMMCCDETNNSSYSKDSGLSQEKAQFAATNRLRRVVSDVAPITKEPFPKSRFRGKTPIISSSSSMNGIRGGGEILTLREPDTNTSFLLRREDIDFRFQTTLRGIGRVFRRIQRVLDQISFHQKFGALLTRSLALNASWTVEKEDGTFQMYVLWDYCDQGSIVDYFNSVHGVQLVTRRNGYVSFTSPKPLSLAFQISIVEMLRQLTTGCMEYEIMSSICGDIDPFNIMVRKDKDKYRFFLHATMPLHVENPAFRRFPKGLYVCAAARDVEVFGDMSLRRIYAQQLQYFHLIWVVLSVTGVSDEVQEMLREASFAPTSSDDDYASRSTLCFNKTEDGLRFASSESTRRLKSLITTHFREKGAEALGALLTELLLNLASPTTEVVKNLLAMRKMLLGLYRFTFKPSSALIAKVRQEVAGAPSIRSVKSLAHHRNDSARLFPRSSGAIDRPKSPKIRHQDSSLNVLSRDEISLLSSHYQDLNRLQGAWTTPMTNTTILRILRKRLFAFITSPPPSQEGGNRSSVVLPHHHKHRQIAGTSAQQQPQPQPQPQQQCRRVFQFDDVDVNVTGVFLGNYRLLKCDGETAVWRRQNAGLAPKETMEEEGGSRESLPGEGSSNGAFTADLMKKWLLGTAVSNSSGHMSWKRRA